MLPIAVASIVMECYHHIEELVPRTYVCSFLAVVLIVVDALKDFRRLSAFWCTRSSPPPAYARRFAVCGGVSLRKTHAYPTATPLLPAAVSDLNGRRTGPAVSYYHQPAPYVCHLHYALNTFFPAQEHCSHLRIRRKVSLWD